MAGHKDIFDLFAIEPCERGIPNDKGQYRQIRVVASPETTGDKFAIIHVHCPAGTSSPGHIHDDYEEIVFFDRRYAGKVKINDDTYDVPAGGVFIARAGDWHQIVSVEGDSEMCNVYLPLKDKSNMPAEVLEKTMEYLAKRGL